MKLIDLHEAKQLGKLYHYIDDNQLIDILHKNKMPNGKFWLPLVIGHSKGGKPIIKQTYGVSLTRSFMNKRMFNWYGNSIITLNGNKLSEKYKIVPHEDAFLKNPLYNKSQHNQSEEFVITTNGIPNLNNYIIELHLPGNMLDMYLNPKSIFNEQKLLQNFIIHRLPNIPL